MIHSPHEAALCRHVRSCCPFCCCRCFHHVQCLPQPKLLQLIKMLEGPGPALQRATLDTVVNELVQEGKVQRKTAPAPELDEG